MQQDYIVIPYKRWEHVSGRTASIYGACPYYTEEEAKDWAIVQRGFTVYNSRTNTAGACQKPWATKEEAQAWIDSL